MNIMILDDHPLFAEAMRQVLLRLGNHVFIQTASSVGQALALLDAGKVFDLMLLDLTLPGLDGFAFMRVLHERLVTTPLIVVSASEDGVKIRQAMAAGAMGYVCKSADTKAILTTIHQVLAGNVYFPDSCMSALIRFPSRRAPQAAPVGISERQFETLQLMERGLSNKEIAGELDIAESTVKAHVSRLIDALAVHNRLACVMEAQRLGIL